jgi:cytochrome P450
MTTPTMTPAEQNLPPGPRWPALVQAMMWSTRPLWLADRCARHFGEAYTLRSPAGQRVVHFSEPATVREILSLPVTSFSTDDPAERTAAEVVKGPYAAAVSILLGGNRSHRTERHQMVAALQTKATGTYTRIVDEVTESAMATWQAGRAFPIYPEMQRVTLNVMLRIIFGVNPDDLDELSTLVADYLQLAGSARPGPGGTRPKLQAQIDERAATAWEALEAHIRRLRSDPDLRSRSDTISGLIRQSPRRGEGLSDAALRQLGMHLVLAGHDPPATALAWAFDLLTHHPDEMQTLENELADGRREYAAAVVKESLRLRPAIPEVARTLTAPVKVGGNLLPAGVTLVANAYLLHQRADLYRDPKAFRPERFLDVSAPAPQSFGGGSRACLGVALAYLVVEQVLTSVVQRWNVRPGRKAPDRVARRLATLIPRHGAPVIVTRRSMGEG